MSTAASHPEAVSCQHVPLPTEEQLPNDLDTLKRMVLELLATLHEERQDKARLRHRLDLLLRRLYGPRHERFSPDQLLLFDAAAAEPDKDDDAQATAAPPAAAASTPAASKRRSRPHGRRPLPEDLPRRPVHHELSEAEPPLCLRSNPSRHRHGGERATRLAAGHVLRLATLGPQISLPGVCPPGAGSGPARDRRGSRRHGRVGAGAGGHGIDRARGGRHERGQADAGRSRRSFGQRPGRAARSGHRVRGQAGDAHRQGAAGAGPVGSDHRQQILRSPAAVSPGEHLPAARRVPGPLHHL